MQGSNQNHSKNQVEEKKKMHLAEEDEILEEIIDDNQNMQQQQQFIQSRDENDGHTASISLGVDQSIDTLRMGEYDYVEEIQ